MGIFDNLSNIFWRFPEFRQKKQEEPMFEQDVTPEPTPETVAVAPAPKKELKKNDPNKPAPAKRVTGHDVTYYVPYDMRAVQVVLYDRTGRFKNEYTLTNYLDIKPGERVRIKIIK